jgi:hypothetical protein
MSRPVLEVADVFRGHGPAWRQANAGHVSLGQLKVMSAIENCRTAALGGHVARCENENCAYTEVAYNSLRQILDMARCLTIALKRGVQSRGPLRPNPARDTAAFSRSSSGVKPPEI